MRWKRSDYGPPILANDKGEVLAIISLDGAQYQIKTKNRRGGWNYGSAGNVRAAKAKAKKMMREEAT